MFSTILVLFIFIVTATSFPFPTFNGLSHHSRTENSLGPELHNRKLLQKNEFVGCEMEDVINILGLEDLQDLIETVAKRKGVNPFFLLRKLNKMMRNREEMKEIMINSIDGPNLSERLHPPILSLPPAINRPSEENRAPYSLSHDVAIADNHNDDTKVIFIPVIPTSLNRTRTLTKPEHKLRKEMSSSAHNVSPLAGRLSNMLPGMFSKNNQLKPPFGATVRVDSGDPLSPLNRDILVTVSPLMTLTEALRQAEIKYQNIFGLSYDTDIITFAHSSAIDCYIVHSVDDVAKNDDAGWKVTILEKDGQVMYDSFCLPNGKDVLVKPGAVISLAYVPL